MRVTVCDFTDNESEFTNNWNAVKAYVLEQGSDLLLLPEMPFCSWVASSIAVNDDVKKRSVQKHEAWLEKFDELEVRYVVYSKPVLQDSKYYNTAFIYEKGKGHREIHTKYYFPEEPHFWEETWYDKPEKEFKVLELDGFKIGVLLCTELWFTDHARAYGKQGADLLLCPRATGAGSADQWVRCGQTVAIISGAYCLSSSKAGAGDHQFEWGGTGFIAAPENGELLGTTADNGFFTADIDLERARAAKTDYPLYVIE